MIPELYDYQKQHKDILMDYLSKYNIAVDSSKTGAGKTITSLSIAHDLMSTNIKHLTILCPPTLIPHWQNTCKEYGIDNVNVYSTYNFKIKIRSSTMLIVDECHDYKNLSKRHKHLVNLIVRCKKVLLLSATPYDDERQVNVVENLVNILNPLDKIKILDCSHSMDFEYKTNLEYILNHSFLDKQSDRDYKKGYRKTCSAMGKERGFNAKVFQSGIMQIHDSLFSKLVEVVYKDINLYPDSKFIIVMVYQRDFDRFMELHPTALILNGNTPQSDRENIVKSFQENPKSKILLISAAVGGVGLELDDKIGNKPRRMYVLPTTNAIQFMQTVGRIQRTHTKSDSTVIVIQPCKQSTYFKSQMNRKMVVLDQFNKHPVFLNKIDSHACDENCSCKGIN
jgi:superfamily II DNA or RNA helicase